MGKGQRFLNRLAEETEVCADSMPGKNIIEIAGENRVLIENHLGIMGYSQERIHVKVKYGCICVCGCGLTILRMTKEQLVIQGQIDAVTLHRRGIK